VVFSTIHASLATCARRVARQGGHRCRPRPTAATDLYAAEVDRIFKRGWIPLCRVEQVSTPGSYYSVDNPRHPRWWSRVDRHSEIRVLSRNCTPPLDGGVQRARGEANVLQCPLPPVVLRSGRTPGRCTGNEAFPGFSTGMITR